MNDLDRAITPAPGKIRDYEFPAVRRVVLENGLRSFVCKAGDIPLITAHAVLHAGADTDPESQPGIANLTALVLEGGTQRLSGTELAWSLEELGLELSAWSTWDATHVRVTATTDRIEPALALLAEIIREPAFPAHEIERLRDEQLAEIMQRASDPRALADDMAPRFIYAQGCTYQRTIHGDPTSVASFTTDDVRRFHSARYQPGTTSIILVGDIDYDRGHDIVRSAFGDWQGRELAAPAVLTAHGAANVVHLVDRPGSVQSEIRIGHVGVARSNTDYFPLVVANSILGGAFTSRLNMNLREKQGFTYGVRSAFAFRGAPGPFTISTAVGTDVTARALEEAFAEVRGLINDGMTDEEVSNARDYLAGVFPLQLQSTEDLAARLSEIVAYNLPDDYFHDYRQHILAVGRSTAEESARRHIRPEDLTVVIAGDAAVLRDSIEKLGIGAVNIVSEGVENG